MTATATLPTPTDTCCSLCGLPAPFCPCDRRDIFTTPNQPLRVEHFTLTDDGRFIATPDEEDAPPTVEQLRARGKKPNEAAAHGPRNIGMEDEPGEERARSEAWFSGVLRRVGELLQSGQVTDSDQ